MSAQHAGIVCPACGDETLLKREPRYEGFKKVGETLSCLSCGHVFDSDEDIVFKTASRPDVFGDEDRPRGIDVFRSDEKGRNCRHCRHYVVNPFTQRCGLHHRKVEATDVCADFDPPQNA